MVPPAAPGEADAAEDPAGSGPDAGGEAPTASPDTSSDSSAAAAAGPAPVYNYPVLPGEQQDPNVAPPGTTIIPSEAPAGTVTGQDLDANNPQLLNYEANQQMPLNEPQLHSLQEFMNEGVNASPLGVELQEGQRRLNGREVDGLLVVAVQPNSAAAQAGVQAGHRAAHDVLEGAAVAASLVFPPAVLAVPVIETIQLGENYDMIIGVDGNRVTNFMDFEDRLRDAQPGETVYLNILRSGKRLQVAVKMPAQNASNMYP